MSVLDVSATDGNIDCFVREDREEKFQRKQKQRQKQLEFQEKLKQKLTEGGGGVPGKDGHQKRQS